MQKNMDLLDFSRFYEIFNSLLGAANASLNTDVVKTRQSDTRAYEVSGLRYNHQFRKLITV